MSKMTMIVTILLRLVPMVWSLITSSSKCFNAKQLAKNAYRKINPRTILISRFANKPTENFDTLPGYHGFESADIRLKNKSVTHSQEILLLTS